ncbi:MAG: glucodextranase DOMON-like domain-containing protein [Nocardioidaceae bacterium]
MRGGIGVAAVAALTLTPLALPGAAPAATPAGAATDTVTTLRTPPAGRATGGPGATSHFDLARKDCVGTAANRRSKVWFTVANGVLSDVYEPTVDTTNVETLQFVVTDGRTFTDLQARDASYRVRADPTGMSCTVTTTAHSGRWRLRTTFLTDPARDTVLVSTRLTGLRGSRTDRLRLFARLDPSIGGNGGGGSDNAGADTATRDGRTGALVATDLNTATAATNRDYGRPTSLALLADHRFRSSGNGYVGTASDGLTQLDASHRLTGRSATAAHGNVVDTAELALHRGRAELALGFGRTPRGAVATAGASLRRSPAEVRRSFLRGWRGYDARLHRPRLPLPGLGRRQSLVMARAYYRSINVVKASEDKTFPGAVVAGLASPWGQAVPAGQLQDGKAPYFGSYREVFSRDLYEAFTALLTAGDRATARATARFLLQRQQLPDGRLPRNSLLNGRTAPDTGGDQLDETAYPILMAQQSGLTGRRLYERHIRPAADFLVSRGPSFGSERWEEQSGYSPSTIAAEIAGLVAAGRLAAHQGDTERSRLYLATADHFQRSVKGWTVTTAGPYASGRYFIRLSKDGDPDAATSYSLGNGGPTADQRTVLDGGFQELTRLGVLPAGDADVQRSLRVVDSSLRRTTPTGDGWYRYGTDTAGTEDGYGDCHVQDPTDCPVEGQPWPTTNTGSGHLWPVLAGERAEQLLGTGNRTRAARLLLAMHGSTSGADLVPEQTWEDPAVPASSFGSDPATASIGFRPGHPAGSAAPLTWAQAQQARLVLSLAAGRPVEQPVVVRRRYVAATPPSTAPLTVTAPADASSVTSASTTVTGTTVPAGHVAVEAANTDTDTPAVAVATTAASDGSFSVDVPTPFGTTVITTTVTASGATGYDRRAVSSDVIEGTDVLDVSDPAGDDNGPGTFTYPTAADFHPGAFDLTGFQVVDNGSTTYLRIRLRNLSPTFGNDLGAQLLTIFAHEPGTTGSTAALYPSRHYALADQDAWARAVQVHGFDETRIFDAPGSQIGTATARASELTGYVTVAVPTALLGGTPGPGWTFTVVLHGQDGFGQDGARTFTPTAGAYTFGECAAAGGTDPRCAVPVDALPKAMDVLTPAGVDQSTELDPTSPVVLRGVPAGIG